MIDLIAIAKIVKDYDIIYRDLRNSKLWRLSVKLIEK